MRPIELRLDLSGIEEERPTDVVVRGVADYLPAYAAMAHALHTAQPLRVIVRHRACAVWLRQMQAKYGSERMSAHETTYRGRLSDLWGVQVPSWVSERDLARSEFLELPPLAAKPGQGFEDLLLEAFLGPAFTYLQFPVSRIVDVVKSYDEEQWREALERPVVREVHAHRLQTWRAATTRPGLVALIDLLEHEPGRLRGLLSQVKVLRGYPIEVGMRAMGASYEQFAKLEMDLGSLAVDLEHVRKAADQIEVYLHALANLGLSTEIIQQALGHMSGELLVEFEWAESCLRSGQVGVDSALLAHVKRVFHPIRSRISARLADLALLAEPARPSKPDPAWHVGTWMRWSVKEYLPYRFWLEERQRYDEEIASYAVTYGDWLYDHFPQLLTGHLHLVYRAILNSRAHVQDGGVLLFIIIDNFNHKYAQELRSLMHAKGYAASVTDTYLSMLPSATIVSKKALATGNPFPFKESAYRAVVEKTWNHHFEGHKTRYLAQIGDLQTLPALEQDFYILNYQPIDSALHSDPRKTGVSHPQAVRQALANLVESIHEFALRFGIEAKLRVAVCADHGSTLIAGDAPNVVDDELVATRTEDAHHRYVALSDKELERLPQTVLDQCYLFRKDVFQLDRHYLAARDYYRFKKTEDTCYVHGGLTPEETIVPYLLLQRMQVAVKPPAVRLLSDSFRYGVRSALEFEIVNVNELPLQGVRVEVLTRNVQAPAPSYVEIPAKEVAEIIIDDVRIRRGQHETTALDIAVHYECAGQEHRDIHTFAVTMKRLMTSPFDFDLEGGS